MYQLKKVPRICHEPGIVKEKIQFKLNFEYDNFWEQYFQYYI